MNGKAVEGNAALVAGSRVYVPVTEFARAAGWASAWNLKTGALTLTKPDHKPIQLTADSDLASQPGSSPVTLKSTVLKEAGQPVMSLTDLLTLVKGYIASTQNNEYRVIV